MKTKKALKAVEPQKVIRLNLGSGKMKIEGFENVDAIKFEGVDHVVDLGSKGWPWKDGSVTEVVCSHFLEHLTAPQRITFCNELYRILAPGGVATFVTPHWNSGRAFGDLTHQWPPICEFFFHYLKRDWRKKEAPHVDIEFNPGGFDCDFDINGHHNLHPEIAKRNEEYRQYAVAWFKEAAQDLVSRWVKPVK